MQLAVGLLIIAAAVYAILKRVDVRLALLLAAAALGAIGGDLAAVVRKFFLTLTNEQFVVPICCAMGFAYVMRQSGCDQHLVHLLVKPLRRVRVLLIPGAVLVGSSTVRLIDTRGLASDLTCALHGILSASAKRWRTSLAKQGKHLFHVENGSEGYAESPSTG